MKNRLQMMWRSCRKYLFVVIVGVLLYELCENFTAVRTVYDTVVSVIMPIILGLCLAFVVNIPLRLCENRIFKKLKQRNSALTRGLSMLISYALVLGIIALIIALVVPKLVESILQLVSSFDTYYEAISSWVIELWEGLNLTDEATTQVLDVTNKLLLKLKDYMIAVIPKLISLPVGIVTTVYNALIALVISIYALVRKGKLINQAKRFIIAALPASTSDYVLDSFKFANKTFRKYVVGQLTSCSIIGVLCYVGMRILGMPYPELIAAFICVAALFPIIGPWISTVPSAFIILMASPDNPWLALWFVIMILVIQQIDNNLIYPRVVGDAVGISGIWVLASIVVGGGLFGVWGLLIAVPTTAVIYRLVGDWVNKRAPKDSELRSEHDLSGKEDETEKTPYDDNEKAKDK